MTTFSTILNPSLTDQEGHAKFLDRVLTPGVPLNWNATSLQVVQRGAGANMSVDVSVGDVFLDRPSGDYGFWGWVTATGGVPNVSITSANPSNPRIDAIIVYVNTAVTTTGTANSPGSLVFQAIAGTPAGSPTAPTDSAIQTAIGSTVAWQRLANVTVGAAVTSIVTANIADTRVALGARIAKVVDASANELIKFSSTASAINEVTVANAAAGNGPTISATGDDTNVDLNFAPKGTGKLKGVVDHLYNPYKFSVYRNAALTPGATDIVFDTKEFDTGTNASTTTGAFTAPVAGFYQFNAAITMSLTSSGTGYSVALYKNGSIFRQGNINVYMFSGSFSAGSVVSTIIQLAANDTITVRDPAASGRPVVTGASYTYFQGYLVSTT